MVVKQPQGLPFPGAQMIVEVVAEVTQALRDGEAVRSRLGGGDRRQVGPALVAGGLEPGGQPRWFDARTSGPDGEHERQPRPATPFVTEIPDGLKRASGGDVGEGSVADDQNGVCPGVAAGRADRQGFDAGPDAVTFREQDFRQGGAGPRALVDRQRANPLGQRPKEQFDAHHRSPTADAGIRDDRGAGLAKEFDRRDQSHVEFTARQPVGQAAGQVILQPHLRPGQAVHERLGVEILNSPHPRGT